jgi:hypothetical protein
MALLKLKIGEPRDVAAVGRFTAGQSREVPDILAAQMVINNPDLWEIEVPEEARKARKERFAGDRKPDIKSTEDKENSHD